MNLVTVTFVFDDALQVYSAYINGVPVCGEGASKEEALQSLKEGILLYMEDTSKEEVLAQVIGPIEYQEVDFAHLV